MSEKLITAGGQAVIEGVMMRSSKHVAIAVRKPDGSISIKKEKIKSLSDRLTFFKWPFLRGMLGLVEMMSIGIRALSYSAQESGGSVDEELSWWHTAVSIGFALVFALALFKFVPLLIATLLERMSVLVQEHYLLFNAIDGVVKIALFVGYVAAISLMSDVKRLFEYHGAEHAAVNCYEAKKPLEVEHVRKFTTLHPRCGTSFILIVLILSILVYTFIPAGFSFWAKLGMRLALLPVIAGISFELLRLAGKYRKNWLLQLVVLPGLGVQKLTTRTPDNGQVEVAIKALKAVLDLDENPGLLENPQVE